MVLSTALPGAFGCGSALHLFHNGLMLVVCVRVCVLVEPRRSVRIVCWLRGSRRDVSEGLVIVLSKFFGSRQAGPVATGVFWMWSRLPSIQFCIAHGAWPHGAT